MKDTFSNIITNKFNEIQHNFKIGLPKKGYRYDEDIMNDVFINCCKTLKDKELTEKEAIKYYWTSYINRYKTELKKEKPHETLDENEYIENDPSYDKDLDLIYDIILKAVEDRYGIRDSYVWKMYVCFGVSSKELRNQGFNHIDNYIYFSRMIKRYILNHVIPENPTLKNLIDTRFES